MENFAMKDDMRICLVVLVPLFLLCLFAYYINALKPFMEKREYYMSEMRRSGSDREYRHWKRMLKRSYKSLIPFMGKHWR